MTSVTQQRKAFNGTVHIKLPNVGQRPTLGQLSAVCKWAMKHGMFYPITSFIRIHSCK